MAQPELGLAILVSRSRGHPYFPAVLFIGLQYSVLVDAVSPHLSAGHDTGPVQHVQGDVDVLVVLPRHGARYLDQGHEHEYESGA